MDTIDRETFVMILNKLNIKRVTEHKTCHRILRNPTIRIYVNDL